jgi:hypothetical protein
MCLVFDSIDLTFIVKLKFNLKVMQKCCLTYFVTSIPD